ncbi:MAG: LysR family transcriptional regulator [Firmicutes bacterium]|nr:LysR family transcriptional regulator [Bacillota bacterium]
MEFYQLEAFVAVARHRSFSRAAEELFLSQPTVSAHIKSLERKLGTSLFDRSKSELILTQAGRILLRYAKDILDLRTHALAELTAKENIADETITIAASSVPCQYLLPQVIAAFRQLYPQVKINLHQQNSTAVCKSIFEYQYPLGIVGEKIPLPKLDFAPLLADDLVVAFPCQRQYEALLKKKALTIQDLKAYLLLLREEGSATRSLFEQALQKVEVSIEEFTYLIIDSQETIKQALRQGMGLSVISRYVIDDYLQFGWLAARPLSDISLARHFYLVTYETRIQTPGTRAFIDFLLTYFHKED